MDEEKRLDLAYDPLILTVSGEKGLVKNFKKRFFNQNGAKLEYFTEEKSFSPQGFIDLEQVTKVDKKGTNGINVITPGRVYEVHFLNS